MSESGRKYTAFISYRHMPLDIKVAKKVHTKIERYKVPRKLQLNEATGSLGKVFRDEEELPASNDLSSEIKNALDNSEYLLVICSPDTPGSIWVEREIEYFLSGHNRDKMIAILAEGTSNASFPELLTTIRDSEGRKIGEVEPLAANLTGLDHHYSKSRFSKEIVRIYAAILKVPFDLLWQRERRHRIHRNISIASFAALLLLAFSTVTLISSYRINERNRQIEQQNTEIKKQFDEIEKQNTEIERKNEELEISRAESLVRESDLLYEKGDLHNAVAAALELAKTPSGKKEYAADTARLLGNALGSGQYYHFMKTTVVTDMDYTVDNLIISKDNKYVFASDYGGNISCISSLDGSVIWKTKSERFSDIHISDEYGILLVENYYDLDGSDITAYDMYTGKPVWKQGGSLICISEDGGSAAVSGYSNNKTVFLMLDIRTGKQTLSFDLNDLDESNINWDQAAFSDDGRYIAASIGYSLVLNKQIVLFDTMEKKTVLYEVPDYRNRENIAVVFSSLGESFFFIYYDMEKQAVCLQEYYFDGKPGNYSECKKDLGMIQAADWGITPHVFNEKNNKMTVVTILDTAYLFQGSHGKLFHEENLCSKDILDFSFLNEGLNEDDIQRSYLYDDGTISLLLGDAGFEIGGRFSQKMHFKEFAISDGFLSSENDGRFACRLDPGTVEAVTCDDEPSTVYIMRPAVDPHVKNAEWSEGITCSMKSSGIIPVDDSHMYLSGEKEDDSLVFRRINVKTAKSEKEYVISEDFSEEIGSHFDINNVYMYKEQNKFGYFYRNIGLIYDLDKGSFKQAFGDEDMIQNCICRNDKEGHMLAAAVIGKINENTYDRLLYPCVLNEEGEKVLLSDSPVKDLITEILCLSGDGSLLYAREDENGKCIYHIVDIDSKEEVQINAVCDNADLNEIGIAPGDCSPVFAMAELDGKIRIYDAAKESVSCELKTEYGTDEIAAMSFCDDDKILAVCTNDKYLRFYDAESGGLLHEEHFEGSDNFFNIKMQIWKDEENSRFCVRLSDGELFMLGTEDFKLISTYEYTASYNPYTREIYRETELSDSIADSGIAGAYLYYPAYTLNELISWGDEFNSDIDRK